MTRWPNHAEAWRAWRDALGGERLDQARSLARQFPRELELDREHGLRVRGEILALEPSTVALEAAVAEGRADLVIGSAPKSARACAPSPAPPRCDGKDAFKAARITSAGETSPAWAARSRAAISERGSLIEMSRCCSIRAAWPAIPKTTLTPP